MFDIVFLGVGAGLMLGMWAYTWWSRQKLLKNGETVQARVAGTAQNRQGSAYVLEFETAGSTHRLQYPRPNKGEPLKPGSQVTLHYDPYKPERMFVEGDRSVLLAERFYLVIGAVLLVLLAVRAMQ